MCARVSFLLCDDSSCIFVSIDNPSTYRHRLGSTEKVSGGVGKEGKVQAIELSVSQLGLFLFLHLHPDSTNHRCGRTLAASCCLLLLLLLPLLLLLMCFFFVAMLSKKRTYVRRIDAVFFISFHRLWRA